MNDELMKLVKEKNSIKTKVTNGNALRRKEEKAKVYKLKETLRKEANYRDILDTVKRVN